MRLGYFCLLYNRQHIQTFERRTDGYVYNICIMEELHSILALGAGGSTKLTNPATGKVVRLTNPKYPQQYMERIDQLCRDKAELVAFQRSL